MKVVCINDDFGYVSFKGYSVPVRVPMLNEILTIRAMEPGWDNGIYLHFNEIPSRQNDGPLSSTISYAARCFRPLDTRKTDISVFTSMLKPVKEPAS